MAIGNKGGRKPAFDKKRLEELKNLMRLAPTMKDAAAFFNVHPDTIEKTILRHYKCSFPEFRDQNMVHTRLALVRKAIQQATMEKPNTAMLIFALKNLCNWTDKQEISSPDEDDNKIYLAYEIRRRDVKQ